MPENVSFSDDAVQFGRQASATSISRAEQSSTLNMRAAGECVQELVWTQ